MIIYVEDIADDKVDVIDYEPVASQPENTVEVDVSAGKFDDMIRMYKYIQMLNEDAKYGSLDNPDSVPFDTDDPLYATYNGKSLVYYKGMEVLTWDDVVMLPSLALSTDATDTHSPYDGVPDIEADGVSTCTITIQKKDYLGNDMTAAGDNDTVTIKASRGMLSAIQVDLVNGTKNVTLTSVPETCVSDIEASADGIEEGTIKIQFAPPS